MIRAALPQSVWVADETCQISFKTAYWWIVGPRLLAVKHMSVQKSRTGRFCCALAFAIYVLTACQPAAAGPSPAVPENIEGGGAGPEPLKCTQCDQNYSAAKRKCSAKAEQDARTACEDEAFTAGAACQRTCTMGEIYNAPQ